MLFVLFTLGEGRYALDASEVVEILPRVDVRSVLRSPPAVLGVFSYRGTFVPAIDLSELVLGRAARARLSTRLIIVRYPSRDQPSHLVGLVVERVTETMRCDAIQFQPSGIANSEENYNGPIASGPRGFVQQIALRKLLPASLSDALFREAATQ